MKSSKIFDKKLQELKNYLETRSCPECGSERITDVELRNRNGSMIIGSIEDCLDCDWQAREEGTGFCNSESDYFSKSTNTRPAPSVL